MLDGNGECEVFSQLFLKHLVCWIWTAFCYAFQRLMSISSCWSEFIWSIHFSFSSAVPLPRNSVRQLVVFRDKKCSRCSSLTLKVGQKLLRNEPNFMWRKSEQSCDDRWSYIRKFFNKIFAFLSPISLVGCECFKKVHNQNTSIISLKFLIRNNRKGSQLVGPIALHFISL
jgi:hypothetical protein